MYMCIVSVYQNLVRVAKTCEILLLHSEDLPVTFGDVAFPEGSGRALAKSPVPKLKAW